MFGSLDDPAIEIALPIQEDALPDSSVPYYLACMYIDRCGSEICQPNAGEWKGAPCSSDMALGAMENMIDTWACSSCDFNN